MVLISVRCASATPVQARNFVDVVGLLGNGGVVAGDDGGVNAVHGLRDGLHFLDQQCTGFSRKRRSCESIGRLRRDEVRCRQCRADQG